jgi:hypothetical protein
MTERWRLINGKELFDLSADPGQTVELAGMHSTVVEELRRAYDGWWTHISPRFGEYCRIELGAAQANPTLLTCHDWHGEQVPVDHAAISKDPQANGFWAVEIVRAGTYRVTLRARPAGVEHKMPAGTARLRVGEVERRQSIPEGVAAVPLSVDLAAGPALLQTWLDETGRGSRGAYFVEVERLGE